MASQAAPAARIWMPIQYHSRAMPVRAAVPLRPAAAAERLQEALTQLNAAQRAAVQHGIGDDARDRRALLVIAGAGSGKTSTLAHRVAHLIAQGADPQRLLLLTFSRRAAQEMERRAGSVLARVLGLPAGTTPALPWAGTFHAVGARLLREYAGALGLQDNFTIHDRGDAEDLMGLARHQLGLGSGLQRFPMKGTCLSIYSRCVNTGVALAGVLQSHFPWCAPWQAELKTLFGAYVQAKQRQNLLDYDDLLQGWEQLMAQPALGALVRARFDHVLVDEYQDTNTLQGRIVLALRPEGAGLTVVGDDAQSIYAFRGATVRNILDFPGQFTPPARVVALERNYRSTPPILAAANAVMAHAPERHAKELYSERPGAGAPQLVRVEGEAQQATWVADQVLVRREGGLKLKQQAVLFRTASHSAALELELARRNIPFVKFGGLKFLEAAHVKDLLALLRFVQNARARLAGFRVVQLVPGIGAASATRLLDAMDAAADPAAALRDFAPPAGARAAWAAFRNCWLALHGNDDWPAELQIALDWYGPQLERLHEDAPLRLGDLEALQRLAVGYGSRERFLTELTLDPPQATSDTPGPPHLDEDYLILSTIHSAKGQEWGAVYLLNAIDGCLPADMAQGADELEEERRLLYVALTRARDHLAVLLPLRFYVTQQAARGDRHLYGGRTRFIAQGDFVHYERISWPPAPERAAAVPPPTSTLDLRARLRAAWD